MAGPPTNLSPRIYEGGGGRREKNLNATNQTGITGGSGQLDGVDLCLLWQVAQLVGGCLVGAAAIRF